MRRPDRSQGSARSKLLTLQDMADEFDVDKKTIARWIQNGIAHKAALVAGDIPTKGLLFQLPEPDGTLGRTRFWQRSEELRHKVDQLKNGSPAAKWIDRGWMGAKFGRRRRFVNLLG